MNNIFKSILAGFTAVLAMTSCDKVDPLPNYSSGTNSVLSASTNTLAAQAADSSNALVTFNWTYPDYATDSTNHKYILQIDSAGKDFTNAFSKTILAATSATFTAKEINDALFGLGFTYNVTYSIQARLVSSYGNNNDRLISNLVSMTATPYKLPPAVALPFTNKLFIIGGATDFGWNQANPMPAVRELTRLDETTWGGIYHLSGSSAYLLLPEAGSWSNKYAVQDNSIPGAANAGAFGYNFPQDIPGSVAEGDNWYRMIFDFQIGRYTVTKVNNPMRETLYITGDATPSGWTNSPGNAQKLTMATNGLFEITMALVPGKYYKFLDTDAQWQPQFGGSSASGGVLGANYGGGGDPDAIPTPAVAGNYKIRVNFVTKSYEVIPQ